MFVCFDDVIKTIYPAATASGFPLQSVTVEVPFGGFDFSVGRHEGMSLLHDTAGEVANLSLLLSIIGVLYTASPEEVPSVFKHSVDVDKLSLPDGDEPAVSRVVVLQCSSYQDGMAAFRVGAQLLVGEFGHLPPCVRKWQQKPRREKKPEFAGHVCADPVNGLSCDPAKDQLPVF